MSSLTRFFFRSPAVAPSTWTVIEWWESRRMAYNAAVGVAGLTSLCATTLFGNLPPHPAAIGIPWQLIAVYGILANVFYTAGPFVDATVCRHWGRQFDAVGPTLFRYGFAFALGLTLLPIPMAILGWGARIVFSLQ